MHHFAAWCSYVGAWLLVAGAVFQAQLELREQDDLRHEVAAILVQQPATPVPSQWWWLLPPVGYLVERRRWRARQLAMMNALGDSQRQQLELYMNKTAGWTAVSLGGFLLATAESWQLGSAYGFGDWSFVVLLIVGLVAGVLFPTLRIRTGRTSDHRQTKG